MSKSKPEIPLNKKKLEKKWNKEYELAIAKRLFDPSKAKLQWEQIAEFFGVTSTAIRLKRRRKGREYFRKIYDEYMASKQPLSI